MHSDSKSLKKPKECISASLRNVCNVQLCSSSHVGWKSSAKIIATNFLHDKNDMRCKSISHSTQAIMMVPFQHRHHDNLLPSCRERIRCAASFRVSLFF